MPGVIDLERQQPTAEEAETGKKRFCSRCGEPAIELPAADRDHVDVWGGEPPPFEQRVCGVCGMGVLLRCSPAALPGANTAFLVVRSSLEVAAVSRAAEPIFGPEETLVGQRSLLELITSTLGDRVLARTASRAALRVHEPETLPVRLTGTRADEIGTMACRISTCGSPRAALVSVEQTFFGRT